jgi:Holliday junction resolvasome RuvABC endonuclease subunit
VTLSSLVTQIKSQRVISLDPASHSLAWCVLDMNEDGITVIDYGKIEYGGIPELSNKFSKIKKEVPIICEKYKPTVAVIEQSVYIQNFQASRILSYIIGFTWGELVDYCNIVMDVNPLKWKSGIGYKNLTKKQAKDIKDKFGGRGIQKRLNDERKNRVKEILSSHFPDLEVDGMDSDISDAIGIGLWYGVSNGFRTIQG